MQIYPWYSLKFSISQGPYCVPPYELFEVLQYMYVNISDTSVNEWLSRSGFLFHCHWYLVEKVQWDSTFKWRHMKCWYIYVILNFNCKYIYVISSGSSSSAFNSSDSFSYIFVQVIVVSMLFGQIFVTRSTVHI